uniref:RING-type domain-containing protein n=1 Tax=Meloidogyne floridensis TaxID=298350 RepID=A0A915NWS2_9BILA
QFYSLNTHALANLFKNSNCVPPFENFSKNSTCKSTSWFIVEEEVKRRLGCVGNTNVDYANIFYKNVRLALKIIHFLQILTSINDYYIKKLVDQIESSNTLLQKLIEVVKEWNECLESLYFFINNTLVEPLDEIVKIVNEYVEIPFESTKPVVDQIEISVNNVEEEEEDNDVKKYLCLQSRLERVYLFTINVEFEEERTKEQQQILFSNDDERTPQIKDCLFLIKIKMASSNIDQEIVRESLECPICKDFFSEPKQLLCGHTFCQGSRSAEARRCINQRLNEGQRYSIMCPNCRKMSLIPENGLNTNYVVKEMVEKFRFISFTNSGFNGNDSSADSGDKNTCSGCSRPTPTNELFFCKGCASVTNKKFICSLCVLKTHKDHDVIMCSDFASSKDREEAANLIADAAYRARSHVEKINGIHEQFNRGFDSIKQVFFEFI